LTTAIQKSHEDHLLFQSKGSLYRFRDLKPGTIVSLIGTVEGKPDEPVAWTFVRTDGGKSFYTSLGHPFDFQEPQFVQMLANACLQACGEPSVTIEEIVIQKERYDNGRGKQR
jgi:hypothetical protein